MRERAAPPPWERENWQDDGPIREVASSAARRAQHPDPGPVEPNVEARPARRKGAIAPEVVADLDRVAPAGRSARYEERLTAAAEALDRGRYADARRMVQPVLRDLPGVAFAHEIAGLALYRLGQWRKAAAELEQARLLDGTVQHHAVLADCYRALRRYHDVDQLWSELKAASPAPALLAEGRIVAAGALADRGDLPGALRLMAAGAGVPKKVREHHLRQWYVLADLHDRTGDVINARRYFALVRDADEDFADVTARLRALGR